MRRPDKRSCVVCAWRETCVKQFHGGPEIALHCIDFTRDVRLEPKDKDVEQPPRKEVDKSHDAL